LGNIEVNTGLDRFSLVGHGSFGIRFGIIGFGARFGMISPSIRFGS